MRGFVCVDCKSEFSAAEAEIVGMRCDMCDSGGTLVAIKADEMNPNYVAAADGEIIVEDFDRPIAESETSPMTTQDDRRMNMTTKYQVKLKRPKASKDSNKLVLEAIISCDNPGTTGNVWIEQRQSGLKESSIKIDFFSVNGLFEAKATLEIQIDPNNPTVLRLVIEDEVDPGFQYLRDFPVYPTDDRDISIDLSDNRTINAGGNLDYFEGIRDAKIDLKGFLKYPDVWDDLPLIHKTKKQLSRRTRNVARHENQRLTLTQYDENGQAYSFHLVCGETIRIGRLEDDSVPNCNDIYLRCKDGGFNDKLFSRFHGMIRISESGISYENVAASNGATVIFGNQVEPIHSNGEPVEFPGKHKSKLVPGWTSQLTGEQLELELRPLPQFSLSDEYLVLNQTSQLNTELQSFPHTPSGVAIRRSDDVPEEYLVFCSGFTIGRVADNGLVMQDPSVKDHHAQIFQFDGSFWIEKLVHDAIVSVNEVDISLNQLVALEIGARLKLGNLSLVAQSWKQHIVDCHCCPPQVD